MKRDSQHVINQRIFTEKLAFYASKCSALPVLPTPEIILFELQAIYLSYTQPLLTVALEGLFMAMDFTLIQKAKAGVKKSLQTAIESSFGMKASVLNNEEVIGNRIFESIKEKINTQWVHLYDYSESPAKIVFMDRDEVLKRPFQTLNTSEKCLANLAKMTLDCMNQTFSDANAIMRLPPNAINHLNFKKNALLNIITQSNFANTIRINFHKNGQTLQRIEAPWDLSGSAFTKSAKYCRDTKNAKKILCDDGSR